MCRQNPPVSSIDGFAQSSVAGPQHRPGIQVGLRFGHCTAHRTIPYPACNLRVTVPAPLQPTLGVSSLDLGRSRERPLSLAALPAPAATGLRSASMTYAITGLLQCNKNRLPIVRRTFKFASARPETVLLPSLGVSSLDLGRSVSPSGPFFFSDGRLLVVCTAYRVACGGQSFRPPRLRRSGAFRIFAMQQYSFRYSAAARPSSSTGRASKMRFVMSESARLSFGNPLFFVKLASSR